ncbi:hypothetical protein GBA52_008628 [Prunus armeniaca]|nr:hypothetical protein GBA52_008628 [Prunus armeniaca]
MRWGRNRNRRKNIAMQSQKTCAKIWRVMTKNIVNGTVYYVHQGEALVAVVINGLVISMPT